MKIDSKYCFAALAIAGFLGVILWPSSPGYAQTSGTVVFENSPPARSWKVTKSYGEKVLYQGKKNRLYRIYNDAAKKSHAVAVYVDNEKTIDKLFGYADVEGKKISVKHLNFEAEGTYRLIVERVH